MKINRFDLLAFICFAGFACLYQGLFWRGSRSVVLLSSDGGNIASFAAASDHPELFSEDELLGDKRSYRLYPPLVTSLIRYLARWTGNYSSAPQLVTGPILTLHLIGFYLLGLALWGSRPWSLLFAFFALVPIEIRCLQEYWGGLFFQDVLPRVYFQALIPYVLAGFFYWRKKPIAWFLLFFFAGLLTYLHPISAFAWGFALWLGAWGYLPPEWPRVKRFGVMSSLALIFLVGTAQFFLNYLSNSVRSVAVNFDEIQRILLYRLHSSNLNIFRAFGAFIWFLTFRLILPCAFIGTCYLWKRSDAEERKKVTLIALWALGLSIASVFLPAFEQAFARAHRIVPLTMTFQRGLRYLIPLLMALCIWPLAVMSRPRPLKKKNKLILSLCVAAILLWSSRYIYHFVYYGWKDEYNVFIGPPKPKAHDLMNALEVVKRSTPPGSRIFTTLVDPLPVRYYALRPLVAVRKDGIAFIYTNHKKALLWFQEMKKVDSLNEETRGGKNEEKRITGLVALAKEFKAQFLLVDARIPKEFAVGLPAAIVYANDSFALLKINN